MADARVYLYDYFDGLLKCERRSTEYATSDAISTKRGTIIAESMKLVDEDLVGPDGHIRAADIPPRDDCGAPEPGEDRHPREGGEHGASLR